MTLGTTTEWRATLVARETACLTAEDRAAVDRELAQRPGGIGALRDRAAEHETRATAQRLDPAAATRRARRAESERRVTLRPAPDTMSLLSGLLPVRQGVAVLASLTSHADSLRAGGDARTRGQIMADTLVERITDQARADAVPVEVQLVMSDHSLMSADPADNSAPARIPGFGTVPAPLARCWLRDSPAEVWVRRLYAAPGTGALVAMDSRRRRFAGQLRRLVVARDSVCRTPWCAAPIRRPHPPSGRRRPDLERQRAGPVRGVQPGEGGAGVAHLLDRRRHGHPAAGRAAGHQPTTAGEATAPARTAVSRRVRLPRAAAQRLSRRDRT